MQLQRAKAAILCNKNFHKCYQMLRVLVCFCVCSGSFSLEWFSSRYLQFVPVCETWPSVTQLPQAFSQDSSSPTPHLSESKSWQSWVCKVHCRTKRRGIRINDSIHANDMEKTCRCAVYDELHVHLSCI